MLNRELTHLSEMSRSGNQVSEFISNTFLGNYPLGLSVDTQAPHHKHWDNDSGAECLLECWNLSEKLVVHLPCIIGTGSGTLMFHILAWLSEISFCLLTAVF